MPAQSPTLSPTLSAMVAGLRGSSSGMPASTLPTKSPPTSAPLVKMPAETGEDRDQRGAEAERDQRVDDGAVVRGQMQPVFEEDEIERDAEQRQARDQHAGNGAGLESE